MASSIPSHSWCLETFKAIGNTCGSFVAAATPPSPQQAITILLAPLTSLPETTSGDWRACPPIDMCLPLLDIPLPPLLRLVQPVMVQPPSKLFSDIPPSPPLGIGSPPPPLRALCHRLNPPHPYTMSSSGLSWSGDPGWKYGYSPNPNDKNCVRCNFFEKDIK
ncbi:hypothetical protein AMTRI_Chr08g163870 [Amborella trichopoda]